MGRIVLTASICLLLCGCLHRTVLSGLPESEAREAAIALYKGNIKPHISKEAKARGGQQDEEKWDVDVDGGDRTQVEAWRILQENGLPRHHEPGVEDVYKNSQLIPTAAEERAKALLALSGELSRSIKAIPGVMDARVHVVMPDPTVVRAAADKPKPSASVFVKYANPAPKDDEIKKLVAGGVEGLEKDQVSIVKAELKPQGRDNLDELTRAVVPTVGFAVDYLTLGGLILLAAIGISFVLNIAPATIRWIRTHVLSLKESLWD